MTDQPKPMPLRGRPVQGALPGERREDRDRRVLQFIQANPDMTNEEVSRSLGVTDAVVRSMQWTKRARDRETQQNVFVPRQVFQPGPPVRPTAEERLAVTPDEVKQDIARRYGVKVR